MIQGQSAARDIEHVPHSIFPFDHNKASSVAILIIITFFVTWLPNQVTSIIIYMRAVKEPRSLFMTRDPRTSPKRSKVEKDQSEDFARTSCSDLN